MDLIRHQFVLRTRLEPGAPALHLCQSSAAYRPDLRRRHGHLQLSRSAAAEAYSASGDDYGPIVYRSTLTHLPAEQQAELIAKDSSTDEGDSGAHASQNGAPGPEETGMSHRWRITWMMALAFVLCNMDKVIF